MRTRLAKHGVRVAAALTVFLLSVPLAGAGGTKGVPLLSVFGSAPYKTDKGVQLLHAESRMREVYGKETKRYDYPEDRLTLVRYVPLGLQFGLVNQPSNRVLHGRIFTIGIFTPGQ